MASPTTTFVHNNNATNKSHSHSTQASSSTPEPPSSSTNDIATNTKSFAQESTKPTNNTTNFCSRSRRKSKLQVTRLVTTVAMLAALSASAGALGAGCRCVKFDDSYKKHKPFGVFTSPNWPTAYEPDIDCLLYTFIAQPNQIIQLSFDSFDLQKPTSSDDCSQGDYTRLYLDLETSSTDDTMNWSGINQKTPWSRILCGRTLLESQLTHYSSGRVLILEFHSDQHQSNTSGFSGTYRFLNKTDFEQDGEPLSGTPCDYEFLSSRISTSVNNAANTGLVGSSHRRTGKFFSPNYPSHYPKNARCAYHFMAGYHEKVEVIFEKVELGFGDISCLDNPDSITVFDGRNANAPIIAQLCNNNRYVHVISTGPDLYIEFITGPSNHFAQGFRANYRFHDTSVQRNLNAVVVSNGATDDNTEISSSSATSSHLPIEARTTDEISAQIPSTGM